MRILPAIWLRATLCILAAAFPATGADLAVPSPAGLQFVSVEVEANRDTPEACIRFSEPVSRQPDAPLLDFISVDPATTLTAAARDHRLCLAGFQFGTHYGVTLKAGLPGSMHALAQAARVDIVLPDRPPEFDFAEAGNVLPRAGSQGLQLRSVNLSKLDVAFARVADRNILQLDPKSLSGDVADPAKAARGAEPVWRGAVDIKSDTNHEVVTTLPTEQALGALQPGLYLVSVRAPGPDADTGAIARYFTVSDLGLTAFRIGDGLAIAVRSLASAAAAAGVDVALIAENNRELGRVRTDGSGLARFDPALLHGKDGDRPRAIFAYGAAGEFSYLDLDSAPDSSADDQRSSSVGRAMIIADRPAYRPGDAVGLTILLRDDQGRAVTKSPLKIEVAEPDGSAYERRTVADQGGGGYGISFDLPTLAQAGDWRVTARLDADGQVVGSTAIKVDRTNTPRLSTSLSVETALLDPAQPGAIDVHGQYAFGQSASLTPGELDFELAAATNPIPAFPDFSFGLADERVAPVTVEPQRFSTDGDGKASPALKAIDPPRSTKPVDARLTAALLDVDGARVERTVTVPVASQPLLLGIKSTGGATIESGHPAHFEIIAVGPDGARQEKPEAGWEIRRLEEISSWHWTGARWAFGRAFHEARAAGGVIAVPAAKPAVVDADLKDGQYVIEAFDPKGEAATSARFRVGAGAPGVDIKPSKAVYAPGESAEVFVKPPYDSDIVLVTADHALRATQIQHVLAAGAAMHVDIPRDGDAGLSIVATALAPPSSTPSGTPPGAPRRSNGSSWLPISQDARRIDVKLELPDKVAPGETLAVPVTVTGAGDETVYVALIATEDAPTAAAGVSAPDPLDFFLGRPAAATPTPRDLYDEIIAPRSAGPAQDEPAKSGPTAAQVSDPVTETRPPVAIRSAIVALDKTGKGALSIAIPDAEGKMRLTAIAWSASKLGHAEAKLIARHPLAVDLALPHFLAPDDRADLKLALDNVDGPRGEYRISVKSEGAVSLVGDGTFTANLAEHEQRTQPVSLQAHDPGDGAITVSVQGPGDIAFERRLTLPVRAAAPLATRRQTATVKPGAQLAIDSMLLDGIRPDTAALSIALAGSPAIDLPGVARELAQRQSGSTEQIVSTAMPFLFPAPSAGAAPDPKVQSAILRLVGAQNPDGGFALWESADSDPWLTAYVAEFLARARSAGAWVPDGSFQRSLDYLSRYADPAPGRSTPADLDQLPQSALDEAAYANAVLARVGRHDLVQLRYFAGRFLSRMRTPLSVALVASGFAALGDEAAATAAFASALSLPPANSTDAYASDLRDQAAVLALMDEAGDQPSAMLAKSAAKTAELAASRHQFTAQEDSWILRAAKSLGRLDDSFKAVIDGAAVQQRGILALNAKRGTPPQPPSVKNASSKPLQVAITATGAAVAQEPKEGGGAYELQRWLFDLTGKPIDAGALKQNDLLVVVLTGRFSGQGDPHPLIVNPLPPGWVLEAPEILNPAARYPWLKDLSGVSYTGKRDDSYIAIPKLSGERHEFRVAFVARAAIAGQFTLPGVLVEDLDRPSLLARTASGRTKIDQGS